MSDFHPAQNDRRICPRPDAYIPNYFGTGLLSGQFPAIVAAMTEYKRIEAFLFEFGEALKSGLSSVWLFLNSQFALTLVGTIFAAFAGAYGAHTIIERNKRREEWQRELRITNAAIMVSFEICNSFLSLKKQNVKDLGFQYNRDKNSFVEFQNGRRHGQIPSDTVFEFKADFRSMNPMTMPDEILVKQVFEQIFAGARAYTLTNILIRTMDSLNQSIVQRNELIDTWKKSPETLGNNLIRFYFGFPDPNGHVDHSYPDSIKSICSLTDDCIFFSQLLCTDLADHGERLKKRLGKRAPNVNRPDFCKGVEEGLMPGPENYEDWTTMFVERGDQNKQKL